MSSDNSSKSKEAIPVGDPDAASLPERLLTASAVPFILRAWWLREFQEYMDVDWWEDLRITGPVWSRYSDPLCDTGSLDHGL